MSLASSSSDPIVTEETDSELGRKRQKQAEEEAEDYDLQTITISIMPDESLKLYSSNGTECYASFHYHSFALQRNWCRHIHFVERKRKKKIFEKKGKLKMRVFFEFSASQLAQVNIDTSNLSDEDIKRLVNHANSIGNEFVKNVFFLLSANERVDQKHTY